MFCKTFGAFYGNFQSTNTVSPAMYCNYGTSGCWKNVFCSIPFIDSRDCSTLNVFVVIFIKLPLHQFFRADLLRVICNAAIIRSFFSLFFIVLQSRIAPALSSFKLVSAAGLGKTFHYLSTEKIYFNVPFGALPAAAATSHLLPHNRAKNVSRKRIPHAKVLSPRLLKNESLIPTRPLQLTGSFAPSPASVYCNYKKMRTPT